MFHRNWLSEAKSICSPKDTKKFRLDILEEEISILEKELSRDYQDIGFCHNDLQYGNIMLDEETRSITLIVSFLYYSGKLHHVAFNYGICFRGYHCTSYPFNFLDISLFLYKISLSSH